MASIGLRWSQQSAEKTISTMDVFVGMALGWLVIGRKTPRTARIGLATFMLIGALGLGWGGGLKLYDFLYPKELDAVIFCATATLLR
jgi:hypothetical protein